MTSVDTPFGEEVPAEVALSSAPLVEVVAQVRFPAVVSISRQEGIAAFQDSVRHEYPVLRGEHRLAISVSLGGVAASPSVEPSIIWRLADPHGKWKLSLATDFLALHTSDYTSRTEFIARLGRALEALERHINPGYQDRIGVRYINRLVGETWLSNLNELVRPELLGLGATPLGSDQAVFSQGISQAQFRVGDFTLFVRSASLPPNVTIDPSVPAVAEPSWLLDLDMSAETDVPRPFEVDRCVAEALQFSQTVYRFFRWSVTDKFLAKAESS